MVAVAPPNFTLTVSARPLPLIVTACPPYIGPVAGPRLPRVGGGGQELERSENDRVSRFVTATSAKPFESKSATAGDHGSWLTARVFAARKVPFPRPGRIET